MINLLPYNNKRQNLAARTNVILVRYIAISIIAAAFLAFVCYGSYILINEENIEQENADLSATSATVIQSQVSTLQTNLALTKSVLDQQTSYSKVLTGLASILPSGTRLDSLSLTESSFNTPIKLQILARSESLEPELKAGFQKLPEFTGYKLVSMTNTTGGNSDYPTLITVNITVNKGVNQ